MTVDEPRTLSLTFVGAEAAYSITAIALPPTPAVPGRWSVLIDAGGVAGNGSAREVEESEPRRPLPRFDSRPTEEQLRTVIEQYLGKERLDGLTETTELTAQMSNLLRHSLGAVGYLTDDPGINGDGSAQHALLHAWTLKAGDEGEVVKLVSVYLGFVCGQHIAPPRSWMTTPLGEISIAAGLVGDEPPLRFPPMNAA